VGAAIVFLGLNIKHEELTADGPVPEAVPA
jgi:hypothetical protein